jgi:hypothetical protein
VNIANCKQASLCEHHASYGKPKFRFQWGYVTHPGVWACGGGRQDLPPVLVGVTFQVPQKEPEYAWWCYIGPRPVFENEFDPIREDGGQYHEQCKAIPQRITKNMVPVTEEQAMVVDCPDCGGGDERCLFCFGTGTDIE